MRSFNRLIRIYIRLQIPSVVALFCSLFAFLNVGVLPRPELAPLTTLIFLFYWSCYWPRLMQPLFLFVLGLLEDMLSGGIIGLHAFLYLLIYGLVISQRRLILKEPFPVVWGLFGLSALFYTLCTFLAYRVLDGYVHITWAPFSQWLVTVAVYPILHQVCLYMQTYLVRVRPMSGRRL